MTINQSLKWKISTRTVTLVLGPILRIGPKCWLTSNVSKMIFCLQTVLQNIQFSQAQSNWFSFQDASTYRQVHADLHSPDMNRVKWVLQQLRTMSSFFCNNYCSKWYQKYRICNWLVKENRFGTATFWVRYPFPSPYLFSGTFFRYLLERISLLVL